MAATDAREKFLSKLTRWASRNGYKRSSGIWWKEDHYLLPDSDPKGKYFVEKRTYDGAIIDRVAL